MFNKSKTAKATAYAEAKRAEALEYRALKWAEIRAEHPDFDNLPEWQKNIIVERKFYCDSKFKELVEFLRG